MFVKRCSKLFKETFTKNCDLMTLKQQRHKTCFISQKSFRDYESAIPKIIDKIPLETFKLDIVENIKKISDYSMKSNENISGPLTIYAYKVLEKSDKVIEKSMNEVQTLAWGAEMVHSYFMILEDVENNGTRNYGTSCWHVNDASLLRSFVYEMLKANFTNKSSFADLVYLFEKAFLHASIGYHMSNARKDKKNYKNFTIDGFNSIVEYKTFHVFNFPLLLAMKITDNNDLYLYHQVESICRDIGRLYQMQNDYLNCYGGEVNDPPGLPMHCKDIQEGRSSWLITSALHRCSPAQRIVLISCYGSKEPAHIERVKLLYDQLEMPKMYKEQEQKIVAVIESKFRKFDGTKLPPELFTKVLDMLTDNIN